MVKSSALVLFCVALVLPGVILAEEPEPESKYAGAGMRMELRGHNT